MDLSLSAEQTQLAEAVRRTVDRAVSAAPLTVRALDAPVFDALRAAGFLDVVVSGGSLLDAVLVIEAVAQAGVCAPVAASALVVPVLLPTGPLAGVVALAPGVGGLVRFGGEADVALVLHEDEDRAGVFHARDVVFAPADLPRGYPFARLVSTAGGDDLGPGSGPRLRRLWRIALAAEAGGLMTGAVRTAVAHVRERRQFGRPIGSYQAVQHRLALAQVAAEGTRWLARWAAAHPDSDERAAAAAVHAQESARAVARHVHQVCGAIGITDEFGLTRYTGKLTVLAVELGGARAAARSLARARWQSGAPRRPAPGYRGRGAGAEPVSA